MFYVAFAILICTCIYIYYLLRPGDTDCADHSIDAYIDRGSDDTTTVKACDINQKYLTDYITEGHQVLIIYGTEYGCAEEIAKLLYDRIVAVNGNDNELPLQPRLINAKHYNVIDFAREQICFIVISTSGDGVPPTDAREFYEHIHGSNTAELAHLKFSLLALGDSNYPSFCKTGRTLHERLLLIGCQSVIDRHDVDAEDWSVINSWLDTVSQYLVTADIQPGLDYIHHADLTEDTYSRSRPFLATLTKKLRLTVSTAPNDKETVHCEFNIQGSDLTWTSGDALGIYPQNNPPEVKRLLDALKCSGSTPVVKPSWAYQVDSTDQVDGSLTLYACLLRYYDLKSVKPDLLVAIQGSLMEETEKQRISTLLQDGITKKNTSLQSYMSNREVADILLDFPSHTLPWQQVLKTMRSLQPRYYSISSSPKVNVGTVCVTAAVVRYEMLGIPRTGVTTTYLQDQISVGDTCPVFMSRNPDFRLPSNSSVPVILIGPGTGLAPFMAFIQERALEPDCGPTLFYFGCRHREKDYLYRSQLEKWVRDDLIKLRVAFSRDQTSKVYVQDLLLQDAEQVWRLVDESEACIYVCGDAKYMAHDVNITLCKIVQGQGHRNETTALTYLQTLEQNGRYQKDVWVV